MKAISTIRRAVNLSGTYVPLYWTPTRRTLVRSWIDRCMEDYVYWAGFVKLEYNVHSEFGIERQLLTRVRTSSQILNFPQQVEALLCLSSVLWRSSSSPALIPAFKKKNPKKNTAPGNKPHDTPDIREFRSECFIQGFHMWRAIKHRLNLLWSPFDCGAAGLPCVCITADAAGSPSQLWKAFK